MTTVKLRAIGNSVGFTLPRDMLARLRVGEGDTLYVTEGADGSIFLSPLDPSVQEQVRLGRELMKEYRETFAALAK